MKRKFIKALKECAKAHKFSCEYYEEDSELAIFGAEGNIPIYSDVLSIVHAFTGAKYGVRQTLGMIIIEMWRFNILEKDRVNWSEVEIALPYGVKI